MAGRLIILEGNISAGKSTLAQSLGQLLDCHVFMEPTLANPYLAMFYQDPKRWGLKMQLWLLRQRFYTYIEAIKFVMETGKGAILDRSVYSDKVFADKGRIDDVISVEGYAYYSALRNKMLSHLPVPHVTLYLDVTPEECQRRILHERCRDCEKGIPIEYLSGLDDCYRVFLVDMRSLGSAVVVQEWDRFGNGADVARAIQLQLEARQTGKLVAPRVTFDTATTEFVRNAAAVREAMTLSYVVEGVNDDDPFPNPLDPDIEAKLEEAYRHALADSPTSSPVKPAREFEVVDTSVC